MNCFAGYTRPVAGGWWAMLRFAKDARPAPVMGEGDKPIVFPTEIEAQKAVTDHLLRYFNGSLRRDGDILSPTLSAANALFPKLIRQRGSSKYTVVETVGRKRA